MLTPEQIAGWQEYYRREPFGFPALDLLFGAHASTVAAAAGAEDLEPGDFMLGEALREATLEENEATVNALEKMFPSRVVLGPDGKPME